MNTASAAAALSALGQPIRLEVFRLLAERLEGGLTVGELALRLKASPGLTSSHLRILEQAGLVTRERDGKLVRCRANVGCAAALTEFLQRMVQSLQV